MIGNSTANVQIKWLVTADVKKVKPNTC